jgi:hypothetical protein
VRKTRDEPRWLGRTLARYEIADVAGRTGSSAIPTATGRGLTTGSVPDIRITASGRSEYCLTTLSLHNAGLDYPKAGGWHTSRALSGVGG